MKKLSFFLMAMILSFAASIQAAEVTETIAMKKFGGLSTGSYENVTKTGTSDLGTEMVAYAFNPSTGQVRGNKTTIAGASVTSADANKNWSLYNSQAMPGAIKAITVTQTATGSNKFQNNLYVALGTTTQGAVTTVNGAQKNTTGTATEFTFDIDETQGYTYFKILSNAKFTSGSVAGVVVTVTYVTGDEDPDATMYTVTTKVNDETMGTVTGAGEYAEGKTATLTANPNAGYKFVNWSNEETANPLKLTVTEDVEITANFAAIPPMTCAEAAATASGETVVLNPFDVVYVVKDAGYIYIKDESGVNLIYDYNLDDKLKAGDHVEGFVGVSSPYNGLPELKPSVAFADLTVTPGTAPEPTLFTEAPVKADVNKYVKFENVTLTANATFTTSSATNATMVVNGTNVTLRNTFKLAATLSAEKAYNIVGFAAIYNSTIQVYYLSAEEYVAPVVNHVITVSANPAEAGVVTGGGEYEETEEITVTATANEGYEFVNWTENDVQVSTDANYTFEVLADRALVANFEQITYHVTATVNPANAGTVTGAGAYTAGTEVTLTAEPEDGYTFLNWTVGGEEVESDYDYYTFTVTKNIEVVANFEALPVTYTISAAANNDEMGSVTGAGTYNENTLVILEAIPNEGYTFVEWKLGDDVYSNQPRLEITATEDLSLVAHFAALPATKYIVTLTDPAGLGVGFDGAGEYEEGAEATVVATLADDEMVFAYWKNDATDEIVSYNTSYTFTVTEDITLSAHYAFGGMTETITNLTIDTESFPSFMGVLIGGPGDMGFSVMLAISEYDDATASFILAPESEVMMGEDACQFIKGHVSYLDPSTVEATAHIVVVYNGELYAIDLDMSFVAEEILPTEVIVDETTLSVEFGALLMKGVWNNPKDGLDYPFTATIGGWNCQLAEAEVLTSITIGGEGEDDPWLGYSEGRMTLTNEDGFLTLTGTPTAYTGPTVKVTAYGQAMIMEMDVDATITVVEDVYLNLNGTDKNSGIEVDLYLDNYTGQDKTYQLNEASTVMSGEIAVYGEITKDGDTYSGVAYAETEEGFYVFPMTLTEFVPEYTMITMDNLQAQVEERDLGWGGLTYTVLMAEGTWSDGEETYPVLLEVTDYDPTITSGIAPISLTIGGMGDDDPWLGSVTDAEVEFTTEGNTITFTGKIANTYAWPAPIYWDIHITATIAPANETVYFVNALNWTNVHAYAWTTDPNATWPGAEATLEATTIADYEVYSYSAPAGTYANVIFNGDQGQTANLVWTAGKYYVVDGWYAREEVEEQLAKLVWTMVGTSALFGSNWDTSDIKNDMARQPDGSFQLTLNNLTLSAGDYEYKAVKGHNWGIEIPGGGSGNASLTIDKDGIYNITFTVNKEETALTHQIELVEEVVVLPTVAIAGTMNGWSTDAHIMVDNANGTASVQVDLDANTTYDFKVIENGNWLGNAGTMDSGNCTGWVFATGESNAKILSGKAGQYTFTWNYDKDELTVTYPTTTGLGNLDASVAPVKVIENGQLIIIKNGVRYNATGAIVK